MQTIPTLLVVPDPNLRRQMRAVLERQSRIEIDACSGAREALNVLSTRPVRILYADAHLDDGPGIALVERVKQQNPEVHVLVGSMGGSARDVVDAMAAGAADFLVDPADAQLVEAAFDKALRDVLKHEKAGAREPSAVKSIITQDKTLLDTLAVAAKVAPSAASVLITGESGTGKELLAAYIHACSRRDDAPYMAINCAALPDQLAESELFGHEKGAFTGAVSRKIGKFEGAGNGTLVLDEITEMALPLQAKLLRALQEREIVRLGGNQAVPVEARVVAISNRDMQQAIADGRLRQDLYYRLNVIPLTIPPLRERKNDIPLLADHFLSRFSRQNGSGMVRISDAAYAMLMSRSWPGNVRELENIVQRGVLIGSGDELLPEHLCLENACPQPATTAPSKVGMTVRDMEKELIFNTLQAVNDNRTHAAKMLGISIRTLRNKLNDYRDENRIAG